MFGTLLATLPEAVLGGCTLMMFGNIVISGLQMIAKCGFSQRNIIIAALSLSIGLGFTQVPEIFQSFRKSFKTCSLKLRCGCVLGFDNFEFGVAEKYGGT